MTFDNGKPGEPVLLETFRDLASAILAKSILNSAERPCLLQDENVAWLSRSMSNIVGGIKLMVREEDVEKALALIKEQASGAAQEREGESE
jgi:hypothetical protein